MQKSSWKVDLRSMICEAQPHKYVGGENLRRVSSANFGRYNVPTWASQMFKGYCQTR